MLTNSQLELIEKMEAVKRKVRKDLNNVVGYNLSFEQIKEIESIIIEGQKKCEKVEGVYRKESSGKGVDNE